MTAPFSYTHPSNIATGYRPSAQIDDYTRKHYNHDEDYPMYHREHCKLPRSNSNCCSCVEELQEVESRPEGGYRRMAQEPPRTTHDIVAAYGVYSQGVEETGFYPQQVVVVSSGRDGSTANTLARESTPATASAPQSCCLPLLLVVLFLLVFLFVFGLLFYFNVVSYAQDSSLQGQCEDVQCVHGGICLVTAEGQTVCRCPVDCPSVLSPVCGSDGHTYENMCSLRLYSCTNKKTILVQHTGECNLEDACQSLSCPAGAECVPSRDGQSASCVCPEHCPVYNNHLALNPICGTDNRDYRDQCEMHRLACEQGQSVSVKYEGHCDPCAKKECPAPELCQLDEDRQPVCTCPEVCDQQLSPVCGSDGNTYANECHMRLQGCRTKKTIRIIYRGTCSSGVNPCDGVECLFGEECTISKFGIAVCECPSQCEPLVREVCGSNMKTYDSLCHLRKASCLDRTEVTVQFNGHCGEENPCREQTCQYDGECVVRGGEAVCVCPRCSLVYSPACDSDGQSYHNECQVRAASCLQAKQIQVVHQGVCNGCETKTCGYFSTCETDEEGMAHCVCIENCPSEEKPTPVCGSDGATYKSICELRKYVCESKLPIELDYEGECELCVEVECRHGARCRAGVCVCPRACPEGEDEPVCASDMETYRSECDMQRHACTANPPALLSVIFYGACNVKFKTGSNNNKTVSSPELTPSTAKDPCLDIQCDFGANCEVGSEGFPRCSCTLDCSQEELVHICGSDFKIYNSTCAMKMEACQKQKEIRLRPLDLCKGMEVKPCNGEGAVVDPETGEELDCGSGPGRKDCPLDSYCHQTPNFARCCPKEAGVYLKSCQDSWYGCCPDKKTPAQGPDQLGCPSLCGCNKIGSYSEACVGDSDQCECRPGVGGVKCDRCEPGYWGLPKISSGYQGCLACGCSTLGSVREDCEQMTGRCVCKPGVSGHKCDACADSHLVLTANGCTSEVESAASSMCENIICDFGAKCEETKDGPQCVCSHTCPPNVIQEMVCGDDGKLYASKCQLKLFVCQVQKHIGIQDMDFCTEDAISATEFPNKRWKMNDLREEVDYSSSHILTKSTRHLISQKKLPYITVSKNYKDTVTNICEVHPCSNGGTCHISLLNGRPFCSCPVGFGGSFCDERLASNSELYYKFIEFNYKLGNTEVELRSTERIHKLKYRKVIVNVDEEKGSLQVNGKEPIYRMIFHPTKTINQTEETLYGYSPPSYNEKTNPCLNKGLCGFTPGLNTFKCKYGVSYVPRHWNIGNSDRNFTMEIYNLKQL